MLAVHEAAANIIEHAYESQRNKLLTIKAVIYPQCLYFVLTHTGKQFDLSLLTPPDIEKKPERGYGLHIIQQIMDGVCYAHTVKGQTCIYLVKQLNTD